MPAGRAGESQEARPNSASKTTGLFGSSFVFDEFAAFIEHRQRVALIDLGFHCRYQRRQIAITGRRKLRIPERRLCYRWATGCRSVSKAASRNGSSVGSAATRDSDARGRFTASVMGRAA